jgi:uncharacterized protein
MAATTDIRFIADVMVGKLARWLRILGMDVLYSNKYEDDEIIQIAKEERRIILTRDTRLAARRDAPLHVLIESDFYKEQVRQVVRAFGISNFDVFSRCLHCNLRLQKIDKESVFERVPPYVYLSQQDFAVCPSCDRVYWHGTHTENMLKQL